MLSTHDRKDKGIICKKLFFLFILLNISINIGHAVKYGTIQSFFPRFVCVSFYYFLIFDAVKLIITLKPEMASAKRTTLSILDFLPCLEGEY